MTPPPINFTVPVDSDWYGLQGLALSGGIPTTVTDIVTRMPIPVVAFETRWREHRVRLRVADWDALVPLVEQYHQALSAKPTAGHLDFSTTIAEQPLAQLAVPDPS